jgi:hypothetical protein
MKTEVIMQRELFGHVIRQKSKTEFFSATDLVRAGNEYRRSKKLADFNLSQWLKKDPTLEFIKTIEDNYGSAIIKGRGRNSNTWVHPYLFIDIALAINPQLKLSVYQWLYDLLLKYRNDSGDSYKKMTGSICLSLSNKSKIQETIKETARRIKSELGVDDWQSASEKQLKLRDKIHENIALLSDILPIDKAVDIGISKALEDK